MKVLTKATLCHHDSINRRVFSERKWEAGKIIIIVTVKQPVAHLS